MPGSTTDAEALTRRLLAGEGASYARWRGDLAPYRQVLAEARLPQHRSEAWQHTNIGRWYRAVAHNEGPRRSPSADDRVRLPAKEIFSGHAHSVDHEALLGTVAVPHGVPVVGFGEAKAQALADGQLGKAVCLKRHPLVAVNALLLETGIIACVPAGTHDEPVCVGALPGQFQHLLLVVAAGAEVELVEAPGSYAHRVVEVVVGDGARVTHRRRQGPSTGHECGLLAVQVAERGSYHLAQSCRGATLRRNDIDVTLAARAEATITGAWRLDERDHLDNQVTMHHAGPSGTSRQTYRGVASGQAQAALGGRIHIAAGADGTDAALSTKNLIAGDRAAVFAKPVLEIHASDVRCAHGATVGALDEAAIHYLRSRGIPDEVARDILVRGFLREAIADPAGQALLELAA